MLSFFQNIKLFENLKNINLKEFDIKQIDIRFYANKLYKDLKNKYLEYLYSDKCIYLNGDMTYEEINYKVDIVLSPRFYFCRYAEFPVNKISQALKLAPVFFEDILPSGKYKYKAIKHNESFLLIAYDVDVINDAINKAKLDTFFINKIFFSQQIAMEENYIIDTQDNNFLYKRDNVVILMPKKFIADKNSSSDSSVNENIKPKIYLFENLEKQKPYLILPKAPKKTTSENILNSFLIYLVILLVLYFIKFLIVKNTYNDLLKQTQIINKQYNIPTSSIVLKSIYKSLKKKRKDNIRTRENINILLSVPLLKGEFVKHIQVINEAKSTFELTVLLKNEENAQIYKNYLNKHFNITNANVKNSIFQIKGYR